MKRNIGLWLVLAAGLVCRSASAGTLNPSGTWTSTPSGGDYSYTITLTNSSSSTDNLGTFWFGWVPGENLLATSPISEVTPSGWTPTITHIGAGDGYAIQWVAGAGASLAPGSSLTFGFTSAVTPAEIS